MHIQRIFSTVVVALVVLVGASSAHAFDYRIELGGFLGGHFFSDSNGLGRYKGDSPDNQLRHSAALGIRLGFELHKRVVLEGELALMPTSTQTNLQVLALGYRLHVLVHLATGRVKPFVLVGGGGFTSSSASSNILAQDTDGEIHAGVSLKVEVQKHWGLRLDGRVQFSPAISGIYFTQDYEVNLGLYGLFDSKNEPKKAAPKKEAEPAPAPPEPKVVDTDKDGLPDAVDKCPKVAGPLDNGGCPDVDTDKDGVIDRLDKCPDQSGPTENGGCPDLDGDKDGIIDRLDKCPMQAGPIENGGCPDTDGDKDGIVDRLDKCPVEAETKNGYQDEDGCPDEVPAKFKEISGVIDGIVFVGNKAVLDKKSFVVLDKAAATLKEFPNLRIEISAHTDNTGVREKNVQLSQTRADAVRTYLIGKGVAADHVTAVGVGPDKPLGDNKTAAGKAKNRRIEFTLGK